ncbi:AAA family ATPase [Pseudomonas cerasi]|uniref:Protein ea59 n=1 Tax=Pseudomonas cerasi TaxID=1583341 RepID=A0A193ST32_9PSED|nr:AAA family ATPase [Pseudomonas cerasi]CZT29357.1 Protein ea59 [Pseudomonas cerasi]SOS21078.1 Protein ea59 [Pseudomonas cerasi]
MVINFIVLEHGKRIVAPSSNTIYFSASNWDDYSFKTSFDTTLYDAKGVKHELGTVKIGYTDQPTGWVLDCIPRSFTSLPDNWFSLGQDVQYYKSLADCFDKSARFSLLASLGDVVFDNKKLESVKEEKVFKSSLMRGVSLSVIHGQFRRVLEGHAELTEFYFSYIDPGDERNSQIKLEFEVVPLSKPSTNIHVLIGRNGVGKTTLLNNMISAIISPVTEQRWGFYTRYFGGGLTPLESDYFSSVVSVSFSVFDPFIPPKEQPDRSKGVAYFYVGMKKNRVGDAPEPPKSEQDLIDDYIISLESCFSQPNKKKRWGEAISRLESDNNFADMDLKALLSTSAEEVKQFAAKQMSLMSSGHKIVLLTITKLVDTIDEKTLVLMDEPESHLHPPLLSAFARALSDLLQDRNGVAIIASHSPVIVQEVPRSCVWKLTRSRTEGRTDRPERETFGENVGVLTREIFGLEATKSGFHEVLQNAVDEGSSFESIMAIYEDQLGVEAQALLRTLIATRDADEGDLI